MKIAILGDTHFGHHADNPRYLANAQRFFDQVFFPYINKHKIDTLIHLGDIVDKRQHISYRTLARAKAMFFDRLEGVDFWCIAGNHDCTYKDTNEINALEVLFAELGNNSQHHYIWERPEEHVFDGIRFLFVPWISPANQADSFAAIENSDAHVVIAHLPLLGFLHFPGSVSNEGFDAKLFKKFKKVITGHFHHKSEQGNIIYTGMPYEQTWVDTGQPKGFHVYDTMTGDLEFVGNPYRMHVIVSSEADIEGLCGIGDEAFVRVVIDKQTDRGTIDELVSAVEVRGSDFNVSIVENVKPAESFTMPIAGVNDTRTILAAAADSVADIDDATRNQLRNLLNELYDAHTATMA